MEALKRTNDWSAHDEAVHDALRSPAVLDRWYWSIIGMLKNLESQFASRENELVTMRAVNAAAKGSGGKGVSAKIYQTRVAEVAKWRAGSMKFKGGIEMALAEASYLRERSDRANLLGRVHELEGAIRAHRDSTEDPSLTDEVLWKLVA
jgi:hypothetical protein